MIAKRISEKLLKYPNSVILDLREFNPLELRLRQSLWFGVQGILGGWTSALLDKKLPYLIQIEPQHWPNHETILQTLKRQGFNQIVDIFYDNDDQLIKSSLFETYRPNIAHNILSDNYCIMDVRTQGQWLKYGCIKSDNLQKIDIKQLFDDISQIDKQKKYIIHCQHGIRSTMAYTLLQMNKIATKVYRKSWNQLINQKGIQIIK